MYGQGNLEPDDADVSESPKDLDVSLNPALAELLSPMANICPLSPECLNLGLSEHR